MTPSWVHDAVFYQIFPDRFATSTKVPKPTNLEPWDSPPTIQGFKGGDLLGVVERLDYLDDLGITAIYLCPVFRSTANHRYHTYDYYDIDPILGSNGALVTLLDESHARNIRIVLDGVFNHCGRGFFQFNHILENGPHSPYIDWFTIQSWPLHPYGPADEPAGYAGWWNDRALPEFNTDHPAVRDFLWGVGEHWIRQGIDGWRLDVPNEIDDDLFWSEFRRRVKGSNSDAYIVGEIWGDARRWLAGDQFDGVMNYLFAKACLGFFTRVAGVDESTIRGTGLNPVDGLDAAQFGAAIDHLLNLYAWPTTLAQLNLIDSHDTARFLTIARGDESALKLAILFQMTFPGAPCIYYGDEIGMVGGATVEDARRGFPWDTARWNNELLEYVKKCVALRRAHPVLRRGSYATLRAENDVYIFARCLDEDVAVVALNTSTETRTVDVTTPTGMTFATLRSVFGAPAPNLTSGSLRFWKLPPRSGSVLIGTLAGTVLPAEKSSPAP
jgi:glycosidase